MKAFIAAAMRWARLSTRGWTVAVALVLCGVGVVVLAQDGPKRLPDANASNCASCHTDKAPLPQNHPPTTGMQMAVCAGCHAKGTPASLAGRLPLSHLHQLRGMTCTTCHADPKDAEPAKAAVCMNCHNPEAVFASTAQVKPTNPHNSPHYGKEADCNLCHHQHEKSENYCSSCHKFDFKVP